EADEHKLAEARLVRAPGRANMVAHQLVNALENDLAVEPGHVQHALVAQQRRTMALDDGVHELAKADRVEGTFRTEDETPDIVVVMMMAPLTNVAPVFTAMSRILAMRRRRLELEVRGQVETGDVKHLA